MRYILISASGTIYTFSVRSCAEVFQLAYGGTLISETLTVEESVTV
jgi:hypothetical protein